MRHAAGVIRRTLEQRIGWHRIGIATSAMIIAMAAVTLFGLLRDIDPNSVIAALREMPLHAMLVAGLFVTASYVALTFYDFFSLRTIGRIEIPYRIAALAGFTSYAIGHNLGATVFTGGAIRLRIYSAWGLSIIEVAKIAFVTGLTFWLGNIVMLSISILCVPDAASALDHLPTWANRAIALGGLAVVAAYVIWLAPRPRAIGNAPWRIVLPNARLTLVQIGIGVIDLGLAALAMFILLPAEPTVDFVTLSVTFVTATLLGFLSHAPGSLGVFEAAMLLGLSQFQKEPLLASLLLFRLLYFVLPLFAALLTLGLRELSLAMRPAETPGPAPSEPYSATEFRRRSP